MLDIGFAEAETLEGGIPDGGATDDCRAVIAHSLRNLVGHMDDVAHEVVTLAWRVVMSNGADDPGG
jgi:hypothetical protein